MKKNKIAEIYEAKQKEWKERIRSKPTKWSRFIGWVWYLIAFPWVWLFYNIRDWRTFLIFVVVVLIIGIEVWLPLLLGIIFKNAWLIGIATVCEIFWLGPGTPFLVICVSVTIGVKALFNKIKSKSYGKREN